ncbi:uncharacterized protein ACLA_077610 [Aspergillus clavatus NRRL 1]|uniref:Uncharacterized protein n=1 Tax=Aspergillus clavatus (strain ATCC 1007 / CBS 513.65 / DSM 816 / NCTC 3887 / NRRL 1 / QM 1276 / 107) TaxID=344612 RepID=A1CLN5_ASPCL|nr:uncharacterized protein ACLA_077610 [Aspergillus clavatus NRRL 1]EAW09014.1 hypothetical protein ACLA_077610 [Aspergillus clavatus NRRL 1]
MSLLSPIPSNLSESLQKEEEAAFILLPLPTMPLPPAPTTATTATTLPATRPATAAPTRPAATTPVAAAATAATATTTTMAPPTSLSLMPMGAFLPLHRVVYGPFFINLTRVWPAPIIRGASVFGPLLPPVGTPRANWDALAPTTSSINTWASSLMVELPLDA